MSGMQAATPDKFDTEGGGSSTQHQFGQGQQYTGSMNIAQGGQQGAQAAVYGQALNAAQMDWDKLQRQNQYSAGKAAGNAAAALGINIA